MSLSNRPLFLTGPDEHLFVARRGVTERLDQAVLASYNVLLQGDRGFGKTTLLRRIARFLEHQGRAVVLLDEQRAATADHLLMRLAKTFIDRGVLPGAAAIGLDDALPVLKRYSSQLEGATVLLDTPAQSAAFELFGRLRDSVWELGCAWVVTADRSLARTLTAPPADAFWDVRLSLQLLDVDEQYELLRRRLPGTALPEGIIDPQGTTPRKLLSAAREASLFEGEVEDVEATVQSEQRAARLGRQASMVFSALEGTGDEALTVTEVARLVDYPNPEVKMALRRLFDAGLLVATSSGRNTKYRVSRNVVR